MARLALIDVTVTVSYGGVQTAVWELARALSDLGHEVTVFGGDGPIRPDLGGRPIRIETFPFTPREKVFDLGTRFRRIVERWTFARHARAAVAKGGYDWAMLTKPFDFFWPGMMPAGARTKFAFMSGGTDFFVGDRHFAKRIDAWLACSYFNAWQIKSRYRRQPVVVYNGVDVAKFAPRDDAAETRASLGVAADATLFAFAGRLVGWKGVAVAIRALADPALAATRSRLLVIGEGDALPELRSIASALGVAERVIFHEPVPHAELPRYYAAADAGVFPSIGDEAFGITIAEAMACGKSVVASHIGGIPEVVGNEESCGLLVPPGDVAALAQAMAAMARDPDRRARMGTAARERIVRLYTWKDSAARVAAALGIA
jgi:glycosyltransferase involved in cell wall biosynthesis